MRRLLIPVLATVLAVPVAAHAGKPTVLDGKRKTSMAFGFTVTGPAQHVLAETAGNDIPGGLDPEVTDSCVAPRCFAFPFSLAPAKRVPSMPVSAQITWSSPTSRFWLHLMDVTKSPEVVTSCYSYYVSRGQSATVSDTLRVSRKYAIWVTVEQVGVSETVKGIVRAPGHDVPPASSVPSDPLGLFLASCQG